MIVAWASKNKKSFYSFTTYAPGYRHNPTEMPYQAPNLPCLNSPITAPKKFFVSEKTLSKPNKRNSEEFCIYLVDNNNFLV